MTTGLFVVGGSSGALATSPDGVNWTPQTSNSSSTINGITSSPDLNLLVAVGSSGWLATSLDGTSWTQRTSSFDSSHIQGVAWSDDLGLFVAVGYDGKLATSPDGITWTQRTSSFSTSAIFGVTWSPALSLFVAVGQSGKLATSPDGINWTQRTSSFSTSIIRGVTWSPALSLFVAVGDSGKLATSPNGTSWTQRTSSFSTSSIRGVTWSPDLNLFVAVGASGKLATSSNGTSWPQRTSSFDSSLIQGVAWSPDLGLFVAVGDLGKLATSPDGINWTQRTANLGSATLYSVTYGSILLNQPPTAPTNVTVNGVGNGGVTDLSGDVVVGATFNDPDESDTEPGSMAIRRKIGAGSYEYWNDAASTWDSSIVWNDGSDTELTTTGWSNGNTYDVGVAFKDTGGLESPFSSNIAVVGNAPPTVTIDSVTDSDTATPTLHWTYGDSEGDPQVKYEAKMFSTQKVDPSSGSALWASGQVTSSDESATASGIPQGDVYAYVRVYDGYSWSDWDEFYFPVAYTPPSAPELVVVSEVDGTYGPRNVLTYTATHDAEEFEDTDHVFERYNPNTNRWEELYRGRNDANLTPIFVEDYTMPYRVEVQYRARTVWVT